jgi:hypothetical protein
VFELCSSTKETEKLPIFKILTQIVQLYGYVYSFLLISSAVFAITETTENCFHNPDGIPCRCLEKVATPNMTNCVWKWKLPVLIVGGEKVANWIWQSLPGYNSLLDRTWANKHLGNSIKKQLRVLEHLGFCETPDPDAKLAFIQRGKITEPS